MDKSIEAKREYDKQFHRANRDSIRERKKNWFQANKEKCNDRNKARRNRLREFIEQQKMGKQCVRCGISDPRVLDFHHTEPDSKDFRISEAVKRNRSEKSILDEIAKCECLCANCHRIHHWERR